MKKGKIIYFSLLLICVFIASTMYFSYAFFSSINEEHGKLNIVVGDLTYKLVSDDLENNQITVAANTTKEIKIKIISLNEIASKYELYYNVDSSNVDIGYNTDTTDSVKGTIEKDGTKEVTVSIRNNTNSNKTVTFEVEGGLSNQDLVLTKGTSINEFKVYAENILNGATPVLTDNLVPVTIKDDGTVAKAGLYNKWYSYKDKNWANSVVLKTASEMIGEDNIYGVTINDTYASFDGEDDYINLGYENYDFENSISVAIKFKYNSFESGTVLFGNCESSGFDFYTNGTLLYGEVYVEELNKYVHLSLMEPELDRYYTLVLTYDGNYLKLYVDGVLKIETEAVGTLKTSSVPLLLGANPGGNGSVSGYSDVIVDEYALYDRVLTEEEISSNMKDGITITNSDQLLEYGDFTNKQYAVNEIIPENNIESYFVWIPKYSYQLWDLGNYSSLTTIDSSKPHAISIKFGTNNTSDSNTGECTTPMSDDSTQGLAGESGNCAVGEYMTHPAFLAFNSNGFWVGKFETGYDGATSTTEAQVNSSDSSKVIVKPNVYSWRNSTLGNMFKASFDYLREDDSHMMKNTEWGAVAYLSHSNFGINNEIRINNNSGYITGYAATIEPTLGYSATSIDGNRQESTNLGVDGTYTVNYLNSLSKLASTTGNITGIYDISGGASEYLMGYTTKAATEGGSSEITSLYSDFFTNSNWNRYYDKYSSTSSSNFYNRILGDATGEMGPFATKSDADPDGSYRWENSWYKDASFFIYSDQPWFQRGNSYKFGTGSGLFSYERWNGINASSLTFRLVLTPTE